MTEIDITYDEMRSKMETVPADTRDRYLLKLLYNQRVTILGLSQRLTLLELRLKALAWILGILTTLIVMTIFGAGVYLVFFV